MFFFFSTSTLDEFAPPDIKNILREWINNEVVPASKPFEGKLPANQYRLHALTLLFMKCLQDNAGYTIPKGCRFTDIRSSCRDRGIGEIINKALRAIEEVEDNRLQGVLTRADYNIYGILDEHQENEPLCNLLNALDRVGQVQSNWFGVAFRMLLAYFVEAPARHGSEAQTPATVNKLIAELMDPRPGASIYDPTAGIGALLLGLAGSDRKLFGHEIDPDTWALCRMNMIMGGQDDAEIVLGNVLEDPRYRGRFDIAVSHPPFGLMNWGTGQEQGKGRALFGKREWWIEGDRLLEYGLSTKRDRADYAFIAHCLESLNAKGRAAILVPSGVLYRNTTNERKVRRFLVKENLVEAVIQLPRVFTGSGVQSAILVFDNQRTARDIRDILFIDASSLNLDKEKTDEREKEIISTYRTFRENPFNAKDGQRIIKEGFAYRASFGEVERNWFNLNVSLYVQPIPTQESADIMEVRKNIEKLESRLRKLRGRMDACMRELEYPVESCRQSRTLSYGDKPAKSRSQDHS